MKTEQLIGCQARHVMLAIVEISPDHMTVFSQSISKEKKSILSLSYAKSPKYRVFSLGKRELKLVSFSL